MAPEGRWERAWFDELRIRDELTSKIKLENGSREGLHGIKGPYRDEDFVEALTSEKTW